MRIARKNVKIFFVSVINVLLFGVGGFVLISGVGGIILRGVIGARLSQVVFFVCGILLLFFFFHGYKIYMITKTTEFTKKEIKRKAMTRAIFVFFVVLCAYYLVLCQYHGKVADHFDQCQNVKKEFHGEIFEIQVCRGITYENGESQAIRLGVFDRQGELRASRDFVFRGINSIPAPVEYKENKLIYFNSDDQVQYFNMPPTTLDWLRARIPFSDIGQLDQLWY